jgi:hypothetical protein
MFVAATLFGSMVRSTVAAPPPDLAEAPAEGMPVLPPLDPALHADFYLENGITLPYPLDNLFRGWTECASRRGHHKALDIGGVGPWAGLGTPVRAMGPGRVLKVGLPTDAPDRYGDVLDNVETTVRSGRELPTHAFVEGYGDVHFFTRNYGRHRSGVVVTLRIDAGPLERHVIHYMHLAAVHPLITPGAEVRAGQEIGLMGGTGVQFDSPHLHLAIENPAGEYIDPGRVLGIGSTRAGCRAGKDGRAAVRARYTKDARALMKDLREGRRRTREEARPLEACHNHEIDGDFSNGEVSVHRFRLSAPGVGSSGPLTIRVEPATSGRYRWRPRLAILDAATTPLFDGRRKTPYAERRQTFELKRLRSPRGAIQLRIPAPPSNGLHVELGSFDEHPRVLRQGSWKLVIEHACGSAAEP